MFPLHSDEVDDPEDPDDDGDDKKTGKKCITYIISERRI
jgi:hypothetical protein